MDIPSTVFFIGLVPSARTETDNRRLRHAASLASSGSFHAALPLYRQLHRKYPKQPELTLQFAKILGLMGKWKQADRIYKTLLEQHSHASEILVRIAHDLEERLDTEQALEMWESLRSSSSGNQFEEQAAFHFVRLSERNLSPQASLSLIRQFSAFDQSSWAWLWIKAKIHLAGGELADAIELASKAYEKAQGEAKIRCSALCAKIQDRAGLYEEAWHWLSETRALRELEASKLRLEFPLRTLPEIDSQRLKRHHKGSQPDLLFVTSYPRSGSTLIATTLQKHLGAAFADEFDYLKQLVEESNDSMTPLKAKKGPKNFLNRYLDALVESKVLKRPFPTTLIDKNPSMAPLAPDLLKNIPQAKVLWIDRNPMDTWLSTLMLDVPLNGVSCWWQTAESFCQWFRHQEQIAAALEDSLPPNQFARISYRDFVEQPVREISKITQRLELKLSESTEAFESTQRINSPTYAEVKQPISASRIDSSEPYSHFLSAEELALFRSLES